MSYGPVNFARTTLLIELSVFISALSFTPLQSSVCVRLGSFRLFHPPSAIGFPGSRASIRKPCSESMPDAEMFVLLSDGSIEMHAESGALAVYARAVRGPALGLSSGLRSRRPRKRIVSTASKQPLD